MNTKNYKKVAEYDQNGKLSAVFGSMREVAENYNVAHATIKYWIENKMISKGHAFLYFSVLPEYEICISEFRKTRKKKKEKKLTKSTQLDRIEEKLDKILSEFGVQK